MIYAGIAIGFLFVFCGFLFWRIKILIDLLNLAASNQVIMNENIGILKDNFKKMDKAYSEEILKLHNRMAMTEENYVHLSAAFELYASNTNKFIKHHILSKASFESPAEDKKIKKLN